ncbi:MAG: tRNA 2-thiouridine(34) synthase MnmA [Bacteroidales bacterium]|nr:tRNA 2-thiouridine(34) synthase MnmA [Bacteroidales bacterium]
MSKDKVLVAMSGGVDSSVAVILLMEMGYEVIGMTMNMYSDTKKKSYDETTENKPNYLEEAKKIADSLNIAHYTIDVRNKFNEAVISNFFKEYIIGKTPNPCVRCNTYIKWETLINYADKLNCKYISTGHYAQIRYENKRYIISKGLDEKKDQSYFLWGLKQNILSRIIFPLSKFTKEQIKNIATNNGFKKLSDRGESQEICFIPDNDYRKFLRDNVKDIDRIITEGNFVDKNGKILGKHKGYPFYTIGQRKGLNIAVGQPLYVIKIIPETNTIYLGTRNELNKKSMLVKEFNLIKYNNLPKNFEVNTKIRYRNEGTLSKINIYDDKIVVDFYKDVSAITPGQSAVFYENDDIVGGGIIES